jgi:putative hydrolase of HD superfamily
MLNSEDNDRLDQQLLFIVEIDKLKSVLRQAYLVDGSRRENDAEHSWHLAMMCLLLAEHSASPEIDLLRVVKMLLIHDIVEIDAGDTFVFDDKANESKTQREKAAAVRLFGMLPPDQAAEYRSLWEEFEARETPEARYAAALDRLHPMLLGYHSQGQAWREHDITVEQITNMNCHIEKGSSVLWRRAKAMLDDAVRRGFVQSESRVQSAE